MFNVDILCSITMFCSILIRYPYCNVYDHNMFLCVLSRFLSLVLLNSDNLHGIDTSQHYQLVKSIKCVIDFMSFVKFIIQLLVTLLWLVLNHSACIMLLPYITCTFMNYICHSCKIWLLCKKTIWLFSYCKFSRCITKLTNSSLCEILLHVTMFLISFVSKSWPISLILKSHFGCFMVVSKMYYPST